MHKIGFPRLNLGNPDATHLPVPPVKRGTGRRGRDGLRLGVVNARALRRTAKDDVSKHCFISFPLMYLLYHIESHLSIGGMVKVVLFAQPFNPSFNPTIAMIINNTVIINYIGVHIVHNHRANIKQ